MIQCRSIARLLYVMAVAATGVPTEAFAQLPGYNWAVGLGSAQDDTAYGVATDESGNCFITGYAPDMAGFSGPGPITSRGGVDAFIARLDSRGHGVQRSRRLALGPDRQYD